MRSTCFSSVLIILHCVTYINTSWTRSMSMNSSAFITLQRPPVNSRLKITDRSSLTMLRLSGTVYLKTFAILYLRRHLPKYHTHTQQMINYSLSHHLSFIPNLRLISSSNHSRLSLLAPFHSRFSGSLNLALFVFHITIIITVSLRSSHFICYTAFYCSIVSENKPPSSFHSCLVDFYRHSKSPHSSSSLFSHLISSYVNIFRHSHFIL